MKRKPETKQELEMTDRFNLYIKQIRFCTDMTQAEIANEMGMSQSGLSELCTGYRICSDKTLGKARELVTRILEERKREMRTRDDEAYVVEDISTEAASAGAEAECNYRAKYEDLLERYQSLVSDYQALVKRLMER